MIYARMTKRQTAAAIILIVTIAAGSFLIGKKILSTGPRAPLSRAAFSGDVDSIRLMAKSTGELNSPSGPWFDERLESYTPIMWAVKADQPAAVVVLLEAGASVNAMDCFGTTAVQLAAELNHTDCLTVLLQAGGAVETTDRSGMFPLGAAASQAHLGALRVLLAFGADVDQRDHAGRTAIALAAMSSSTLSGITISTLAQAGGDVNSIDLTGRTPLDWAEEVGNDISIRELRVFDAKNSRTPKNQQSDVDQGQAR